MCIVLLSTSHPSYPLILIDNRDEFILRPTSRPAWWRPKPTHPTLSPFPTPKATEVDGPAFFSGTASAQSPSSPLSPSPAAPPSPPPQHILSSRDLQRAERGTWLGITKAGHVAVLTNYREEAGTAGAATVHTPRSRGGMVTAWLSAPAAEPTADFVRAMLAEGDIAAVGGFSLLCGKLRRRGQRGLAILSNRSRAADTVSWVGGEPGREHGLSNVCYYNDDSNDNTAEAAPRWPKVESGRRLLREAVDAAVEADDSEDRLLERLFAVLDTDTLPPRDGLSFEDAISMLKESIFVPLIGDDEHREAMTRALEAAAARRRKGREAKAGEGGGEGEEEEAGCGEEEEVKAVVELIAEERPDQQASGFMTGLYGTQRQTVILVDVDGNVTFVERALWNAHGAPIERGKGDVYFRFKIEGWDEDEGEGGTGENGSAAD